MRQKIMLIWLGLESLPDVTLTGRFPRTFHYNLSGQKDHLFTLLLVISLVDCEVSGKPVSFIETPDKMLKLSVRRY